MLYNLKDDPAEKKDVASRYPQVVTKMKTTMDKARVSHELWPLKGTMRKYVQYSEANAIRGLLRN